MSGTWVGRGLITVAAAALLATAPAASAAQEDVTGPGNRAVIVPDETAAVVKRANELCEQLFSYDYTAADEHERLVEESTTDTFAEEFEAIYGAGDEAASRQYVLTSTVARSAVRYLTRSDAEVLVYLDQASSSTAGDSTGEAMFIVVLRRVDGEWLADGIETFGNK